MIRIATHFCWQVLMDAVENISSKRVSKLSDAMLLLECVACVKAIMNSRIGLDYIITHKQTTKTLVNGSCYHSIVTDLKVM